MRKKWLKASVAALFMLMISSAAFASMSSTNYRIDWDAYSAGGQDDSSSTSYQVRETLGVGADQAESSSYTLRSGYRPGVFDETATFAVYMQDDSTQTAATAISGTTVTLTKTSQFSVGEMVALIQDEGASQQSAIGKITSINTASNTVTVDAWSGSVSSIDGSDDYLYDLGQTSIDLGLLNRGQVTTRILAWDVSVENDDGYNVYVYEDGDLADGSEVITDVSDGTVTAGTVEYGARSSDSSLASSTFDTQDTAFTSTMQQVASRADTSFVQRDYLTIKASISASTVDGTYAHTLNVIYVGDY